MTNRPLKGQEALVTGASSGIGKGGALALGAAGADVVVNYLTDPQTAQALVEEIGAGDVDAMAIRANVSREDQARQMGGETLAARRTISGDGEDVHGQTIFVDGGMTLYPEFARGG